MKRIRVRLGRPATNFIGGQSMNARKCVHAQKSYFTHESREDRGRETGKTDTRTLMERNSAQQNKNLYD